MALIVEDGSIVANANSYVSITDARLYASDRGWSLNADDDVLTQQLIVASDYLETFRKKYQGAKTDVTQSLQFPRYPLYIDNVLQAADSIPTLIIASQIRLAVDLEAGIEIQPTTTEAQITLEKVGPITTMYSDKYGPVTSPTLRVFNSLIEPLLNQGSLGSMTVMRG